MADTPEWIKKARSGWKYYGQERPSFAKEPEEGEESVWDYPRPPALSKDDRLVQVYLGETLIAESKNAIRILETASPPTFYIPKSDVQMDLLNSGTGSSHCEWKGKATYWDISTPGKTIRQAGWSYEDPYEEFEKISGYLSFYPSKLRCMVNEERVKPQPGGFYGGWITSEIVGPVKGEGPETML